MLKDEPKTSQTDPKSRQPTVFRFRTLVRDLLTWLLKVLVVRGRRVWLFGSWFGKRYADNPRYVYEYVCKHCPEILPVWISEDPSVVRRARNAGGRAYLTDSFGAKLWRRVAEAILTTMNSPLDVGFRWGSNVHHIALWHGMPLKKIALDEKAPWPLRPQPSLAIATSSEFAGLLAGAFGMPRENVVITGEPRSDVLVNPLVSVSALHQELQGDKPHPKIISYLPTHRDDEWKGPGPKNLETIVREMQQNRLLDESLSQHNAILFVKGHFNQSVEGDGDHTDSDGARVRILPHRPDFDTEELLAATDILITDYSSCYVDFLLTGRPVVLFAYDFDHYVTHNHGLYFEYSEVAAGPIVDDVDSLAAALKRYLADPAQDTALRMRIGERFHLWTDGQSTRRVVHEILRRLGLDDNCSRNGRPLN